MVKHFWNKLNPVSKTAITGITLFCLQFFIGGEGLKLITGEATTNSKLLLNAAGKIGFVSFFAIVLPFYFAKTKAKKSIFYLTCLVSYVFSMMPLLGISGTYSQIGYITLFLVIGFPLIVLSNFFFNYLLKGYFSFDVFESTRQLT
jgi:hypothetical protein